MTLLYSKSLSCKSICKMKTAWNFPKKLKIKLIYDPAITLLGIYPKVTNVVIQRGMFTRMFIAAMSTIAKLGKNLDVHQQ